MHLAYLCFLLPTMVFAGAGCAANEDPGCTSDAECRDGRVCIDGACAPETSRRDHEFFGQFVYEVSGRHVEGVEAWPDEVPRSRGFRLSVFLMESGDAILFYEEGFFGHGFNPRNRDDDTDPRRRIPTSWSIVDDTLIVGDLLLCTAAPAEEPRWEGATTYDGIRCEIQRAIGDPRTEGVPIVLSHRWGQATSPDDEWFSEFPDE